jgi:hypothetical protein
VTIPSKLGLIGGGTPRGVFGAASPQLRTSERLDVGESVSPQPVNKQKSNKMTQLDIICDYKSDHKFSASALE